MTKPRATNMIKVEHKDYKIMQSRDNGHIIVSKDSSIVLQVPCNQIFDTRELQEMIDNCIEAMDEKEI